MRRGSGLPSRAGGEAAFAQQPAHCASGNRCRKRVRRRPRIEAPGRAHTRAEGGGGAEPRVRAPRAGAPAQVVPCRHRLLSPPWPKPVSTRSSAAGRSIWPNGRPSDSTDGRWFHNTIHRVMIGVMKRSKSRRCQTCRRTIKANPLGGRPRLYCSAACRQRAYRKRVLENPQAVTALKSDLREVQDRTARARQAVNTLEDLGFAVRLARTPDSVANAKLGSEGRKFRDWYLGVVRREQQACRDGGSHEDSGDDPAVPGRC